jgi:membrane protein DedA with SNARE-associated domain
VPPSALVAFAQQQTSVLAYLHEAWAYIALGASAIVTEELAPLLGGFAAEQGHLGFTRVVLVVAVGVWAATVGLYFLGRWRAGWVRLKLRGAPPIVRRLLSTMRWSPWWATIVARFAFGGRIILPLACGAAHVPIWIFLTGTAIASVIWALVFAALGWFFGQTAVVVLGRVKEYEGLLTALLVLLSIGAFIWIRRRQKRAQG